MASLSLVFDLLARDRASSEFRKVGDAAERAGKQGHGFGSSIGTGMKIAAGAFAAAGIGTMFAGFLTDAAESIKISRLTTQVIKSTGGAAGITAKQVGNLATAISNKTGVDDEAIQSASNLLLTFTNVRNEVGKGNDIFNRATSTITDMSVALGQDTSSSAIQLGKALNDPIKGVSALARVGVSFTAQQKEQIKTLVKSGDTLGAQKIILAELGKEFGGAAAAAATPMDRLKVIVGNLGEQIGGTLLPYVGKFANFISNTAIPAISKLWGWLGPKLGAVFHEIIGGIMAFGAAWKYNDGDITSSGLPGFMERVGYYARQAFDYVKKNVIPVLASFGGWVKDNSTWLLQVGAALLAAVVAFKAFMFIKSVITAVAAFNAVLLANPIGLVIAAIAALVAGFVIAYKNCETFRNIVDGAFRVVAAAATWMWKNVLEPYFTALWTLWSNVAKGVMWAWTNLLQPTWKGVVSYVTFMWNNILKPYFTFIWDLWTALAKGIGWAWTNLIHPVFVAFGKVIGVLKDGFKKGVEGIGAIWEGLKKTLMAPVQWVIDFVWNDGLRKLWNVINNLWGGSDIKPFTLGGSKAAAKGGGGAKMRASQLANGGVLPGYTPGRDVHHFISPTGGALSLSGGEAVMRPEFTAALGVHGVNKLNAVARSGGAKAVANLLGGQQNFASGGVISLPGWLKVIPGIGAIAGLVNHINGGNGWGGGDLGKGLMGMIRGAGGKLWAKAKSLWDGLGGSSSGGGGKYTGMAGRGVQRWQSVVLQSLAMMGQPASLLQTVLRRMNQESGGNPTIVNRSDSNWRRGTPSVGLMQVIGPTYRAYADKRRNVGPYSYGTSVDPLANILASEHYALARYGSLSAAYNKSGGYALGTDWVPETGSYVLHKGEAVVPAAKNSGYTGGVTYVTQVSVDRDAEKIARAVERSQRTREFLHG